MRVWPRYQNRSEVQDVGFHPNLVKLHDNHLSCKTKNVYDAPEVIKSRKFLSKASNMYSMGVILYEMLHGVVPYCGPTEAIIREIYEKQLILKACIISTELGDFLKLLLHPKPWRRPSAKDSSRRNWTFYQATIEETRQQVQEKSKLAMPVLSKLEPKLDLLLRRTSKSLATVRCGSEPVVLRSRIPDKRVAYALGVDYAEVCSSLYKLKDPHGGNGNETPVAEKATENCPNRNLKKPHSNEHQNWSKREDSPKNEIQIEPALSVLPLRYPTPVTPSLEDHVEKEEEEILQNLDCVFSSRPASAESDMSIRILNRCVSDSTVFSDYGVVINDSQKVVSNQGVYTSSDGNSHLQEYINAELGKLKLGESQYEEPSSTEHHPQVDDGSHEEHVVNPMHNTPNTNVNDGVISSSKELQLNGPSSSASASASASQLSTNGERLHEADVDTQGDDTENDAENKVQKADHTEGQLSNSSPSSTPLQKACEEVGEEMAVMSSSSCSNYSSSQYKSPSDGQACRLDAQPENTKGTTPEWDMHGNEMSNFNGCLSPTDCGAEYAWSDSYMESDEATDSDTSTSCLSSSLHDECGVPRAETAVSYKSDRDSSIPSDLGSIDPRQADESVCQTSNASSETNLHEILPLPPFTDDERVLSFLAQVTKNNEKSPRDEHTFETVGSHRNEEMSDTPRFTERSRFRREDLKLPKHPSLLKRRVWTCTLKDDSRSLCTANNHSQLAMPAVKGEAMHLAMGDKGKRLGNTLRHNAREQSNGMNNYQETERRMIPWTHQQNSDNYPQQCVGVVPVSFNEGATACEQDQKPVVYHIYGDQASTRGTGSMSFGTSSIAGSSMIQISEASLGVDEEGNSSYSMNQYLHHPDTNLDNNTMSYRRAIGHIQIRKKKSLPPLNTRRGGDEANSFRGSKWTTREKQAAPRSQSIMYLRLARCGF